MKTHAKIMAVPLLVLSLAMLWPGTVEAQHGDQQHREMMRKHMEGMHEHMQQMDQMRQHMQSMSERMGQRMRMMQGGDSAAVHHRSMQRMMGEMGQAAGEMHGAMESVREMMADPQLMQDGSIARSMVHLRERMGRLTEEMRMTIEAVESLRQRMERLEDEEDGSS